MRLFYLKFVDTFSNYAYLIAKFIKCNWQFQYRNVTDEITVIVKIMSLVVY